MAKREKENTELELPKTEGEEVQEERALAAGPAESIEEELKRLNESLEAKTKEAEINYDKFLRACADFENYKKRVEKEKGELVSFANERLIKEVIPVVDNLERAIDHMHVPAEPAPAVVSRGIKQGEDESDLSAVKDGIKLVLDNLLAVLKKFGVEVVSAVGEKFDPTKHEAVAQEETAEHEPGVVIKEFHKYYYLNNRLIRPAMVVISKAPEPSTEMKEVTEGED